MKTNLMHNLSAVYFISQPLHVSGIFVANHQEVYCIYTTICTCFIYIYIYRIPPDDGLQKCPKHVQVNWRNKLRINSASLWVLLHGCIEMHGKQSIKFYLSYLSPILIFSSYLSLGFLTGSFYFKFPHSKILCSSLVFILATWPDYLVFILLVNLKSGLE